MRTTIKRVEVFGVEMPLVGSFVMVHARRTMTRSAVVRITAADGTTGISSVELDIPTPSETKRHDDVLKTLRDEFAPALIGLDAANINVLMPVLNQAHPAFSHAKVAIEMACVDLTARSFGVPVYAYLGGAVNQRLEFNAWIGMLPPQEAAAEALHFRKQGFRSAKIKIGGGIHEDRDRIAAVRAAVGSEMALRIDANESYDVDTSIRLAQMVREFNLQHFEQPAPADDLAGLARVRREGGVRVMADESVVDHESLLAVIKAEAADVVKFGIRDVGGFHVAARMLATAEAAGIPCVIGHGWGLDVSTLADIMLAATSNNVVAGLECVGPTHYKDTVTTTRLDISSGSLALPPGPGLGVNLDDTKLAQYRF